MFFTAPKPNEQTKTMQRVPYHVLVSFMVALASLSSPLLSVFDLGLTHTHTHTHRVGSREAGGDSEPGEAMITFYSS